MRHSLALALLVAGCAQPHPSPAPPGPRPVAHARRRRLPPHRQRGTRITDANAPFPRTRAAGRRLRPAASISCAAGASTRGSRTTATATASPPAWNAYNRRECAIPSHSRCWSPAAPSRIHLLRRRGLDPWLTHDGDGYRLTASVERV